MRLKADKGRHRNLILRVRLLYMQPLVFQGNDTVKSSMKSLIV